MSAGVLLIVVATEAERPAVGADTFPVSDVLVCGVGKSAAGVATALRLSEGGVRGVLSFGVAGAYPSSGLAVGDVVVATEVAVLDEGLERGDSFASFARPGMAVPGAAWTPTDPFLRSGLDVAQRDFRVVTGRVATVSACAGTARMARERAATGALAEGMEGAAIALAAARRGVPFAEIRGIANPCGPRDDAPFDLAIAVQNAARVLARVRLP